MTIILLAMLVLKLYMLCEIKKNGILLYVAVLNVEPSELIVCFL